MSPLALPLAVLLAAAPASTPLEQLLGSRPADSLVAPLERLESARRGPGAASAALRLGQLRYARGEYRQAAAAFARATAAMPAELRHDPRYWTGLAWLGAGETARAREAFEQAARGPSRVRELALLGLALSWEAERRPERALDGLQALLAADPGEAGPAALEHTRSLALQLGRPEVARRAAERLERDNPRSVEAVRAAHAPAPAAARGATPGTAAPARTAPAPVPRRAPPPPPAVSQGPLTVQIGAFREAGHAQVLAARARRAGFGPVRVSEVRDAAGPLFLVRVGVYATAEDARGAAARLERGLGVACRLVAAP